MTEMHGDPELDEKIRAATAIFQKDVGTWDADMEITPAPGMPPVQAKGVATARLVGDRWLVIDVESDAGFAGHGVYGWDAATDEYTSLWVDSMQSSPARGRGRWDPDTATMTYEVEAWSRGLTIRYREHTEHRADGSQLYRNVVLGPDGGEFEMIHTVYRRRD